MSENIVDLGDDDEVKVFPCGALDFRSKSTINGEPEYRLALYPEQGQILRAALCKEEGQLRARLSQAERLAEALREYACDRNWCYDTCSIGRSVAKDALTAWEAGQEQSNA